MLLGINKTKLRAFMLVQMVGNHCTKIMCFIYAKEEKLSQRVAQSTVNYAS